MTGRREKIAAALILTALAAALAAQAWHLGVTVDEPAHLVSSYLYWHGRDNLEPHDLPPLIKIAGGWVPRLMGLPLDPSLGGPDETRHEWNVSQAMMEHMDRPRIQWVFFWSRISLMVFPLMTAALVWRWSRQLFGPGIGLLLMLVYAIEPTAMAHGSVFKNDIAATFGYLLFWYSAWRYWRRPGLREAAWLGAALLVALLAKMSMLFLVAFAPVIVVLRAITRRGEGTRAAAAALLLVLLIPYAGTLAAYQFDTRRMSAHEIQGRAIAHGLPGWFVLGSQIFRVLPLPQRMWDGCAWLFDGNARPVPVYLLGNVYPQGHPFYFPIALAVKIPAPLQILLAGGILLAIARLRRRSAADAFWIVPGFLYIGLASLCAFQLGVRLVLPALPFGLMLCGIAAAAAWRGRWRAAPLAMAAWLLVQAVAIYPHGMSFMNAWTGGAENGLEYLADSNVDWGQGLPDLAEYVKEQKISTFRLSYFGTDNVFRFFPEDQVELVAPPWDDSLVNSRQLVPRPGYYAISASLLPGQFFEPKYRDYFDPFRHMQPVAKVADSIYMYKVGL